MTISDTQGPLKKTGEANMHSGSNDECNSSGWQTDPDNPMLGPDGQLRYAHERPHQFVHSPSEGVTSNFHLRDNTEDDLPAALWTDVNT